MKECKKLKTLKLDSDLFGAWFEDNRWKDFNLKLSSFHIQLRYDIDRTNIARFIASQAPTLTTLHIRESYGNTARCWFTTYDIISDLTNLKGLSLGLRSNCKEIFLRQWPELERLTLPYVQYAIYQLRCKI